MLENELPFVSVIVPVRNEERLIADCLQSLLHQDYPKDRLEIIAVDNDSKDRSRSVIRQFPVQYVFEKTRGAAAARNAGARAASGNLLAFTDSDCIAPPNWVRGLVHALAEAEADASGGDCAASSPSSLIEDYHDFRGTYSQAGFFSSSSPSLPWLLTGNLMVRRNVFEEVGGFEETLFMATEDIDFSWKIVRSGGRLAHCPWIKVLHQEPPSLVPLYLKNFRSGLGTFLVNRRHGFRPAPNAPHLLDKLKGHLDLLFLRENGLSFQRKLAYLFLIGTGCLVFQAGISFNWMRYDGLKIPLPIPLLERRTAPLLPSPEPELETA